MVDVLRKQQATWAESQEPAKAEDRVVIDFVGSVDGEEFEGGKQLISYLQWVKAE